MEFEDISDEALLAAMDAMEEKMCPPRPTLPPQPPLPLSHLTHQPAARPLPPPAACSVRPAPLQPREEPQPEAAQDQPPPMSSTPCRSMSAATQAPKRQPPTLPPGPVSAKERHSGSRAGCGAKPPAPQPSGARQASPSVPPRHSHRPVTGTPPKQQPPTLPPGPVSAKERHSGSRAGGAAAPPAPPSAPRSGAPPSGRKVLTVLHLFSGPANKKEGLKATIY